MRILWNQVGSSKESKTIFKSSHVFEGSTYVVVRALTLIWIFSETAFFFAKLQTTNKLFLRFVPKLNYEYNPYRLQEW